MPTPLPTQIRVNEGLYVYTELQQCLNGSLHQKLWLSIAFSYLLKCFNSLLNWLYSKLQVDHSWTTSSRSSHTTQKPQLPSVYILRVTLVTNCFDMVLHSFCSLKLLHQTVDISHSLHISVDRSASFAPFHI